MDTEMLGLLLEIPLANMDLLGKIGGQGMLRDELHDKRAMIMSIAKKYGAENVQVFGSVARQEETKKSDIDILVSLPRGYDMFKQRIPLQEELMELFGRRVDLVVRHELNRHLKVEILSNARDI